jgi:hypothetical protein
VSGQKGEEEHENEDEEKRWKKKGVDVKVEGSYERRWRRVEMTMLRKDDRNKSLTHTTSRRSSLTSNERNDRLLDGVILQVFSSLFFGLTSDLTNENDTLCFGILKEKCQNINKVGSVERITSNSNTS